MSSATRRADAPLRAIVFMLAGAASFATMNALAGSMKHIPWPILGLCRAFFGLCASLLIARARGASLAITDRRRMWQRSLAGSTGMLCTFYALTHMPLADATALLNTTPLWIALLAWALLGERPSARVAAALAVAAVGVVLIERPSLRGGDGVAGLSALAAGCTGAVAMISLRRLKGETPEAVVVHFSAVATAVMLCAAAHWITTHAHVPRLGADDAVGVLAMALSATVGQLAITRAYALDKAARVGAAGWIQIALALGLDAAVFRRWPAPAALCGIALLLASGALLLDDARRAERAPALPE